jgi:hypothetical protein
MVSLLNKITTKCKTEGKAPENQIEKDLWNQLIKIIRALLTAQQLAKI